MAATEESDYSACSSENDDDSEGGQNSNVSESIAMKRRKTEYLPPIPSHSGGDPLSAQSKLFVLRLFVVFKNEYEMRDRSAGPVDLRETPAHRVAVALGIGHTTVSRIVAEFRRSGTVSEPLSGNRVSHKTSVRGKAGLLEAIRSVLLDNAAKGVATSVPKLLAQLQQQKDSRRRRFLPLSTKYLTFLRTVRSYGFEIASEWRKGDRAGVKEPVGSRGLRWAYNKVISANRQLKAGRLVEVYFDESYVNEAHRTQRTVLAPGDASTVPRIKKEKGRRWCFAAGITAEKGVIEESIWVFCPNKSEQKKQDYHSSFNSKNFEQYFKIDGISCDDKLVGLIRGFERAFPYKKALFIMDNASYHKFWDPAVPSPASKKAVIQAYLREKRVRGTSDDMPKEDLVVLLKRYRAEHLKTVLEEYAEKRGHKILFTPPRHSDLQPIELYWAAVKGEVARQFTADRTLAQTKEQLLAALQHHGTSAKCRKLIKHCNETLDRYMADDLECEKREDARGVHDVEENEDNANAEQESDEEEEEEDVDDGAEEEEEEEENDEDEEEER